MGFPKISKKGDVRFHTKMGEVGIAKRGNSVKQWEYSGWETFFLNKILDIVLQILPIMVKKGAEDIN